MATAASGASLAGSQRWVLPSSPSQAVSGVPNEYAVPRLLQCLVPPALVKWMRAEVDAGHRSCGFGEGNPANADETGVLSWRGAFGMQSLEDNEDDLCSGVNPLFPLAGAVDAQLSRLGGEAWEALKSPAKREIMGESLLSSLDISTEGDDVSGVSRETGPQLSLGESRALLQALLPLAAQRFCAAVSSDQQQQKQQCGSNSHPISGVFSVIPQPSEAAADGPQHWLGASQKSGSHLTCGPVFGPLCSSITGLSGGLHPNSEVQRRRLRRRRQTLLRQLLKSRAVLMQLSQQPEAETRAALPAGKVPEAETGEAQREVLRQRIGTELRRAAITAYNLSCCCQEERRHSGISYGETILSEGTDVKEEIPPATHQTGHPSAAAATQRPEQQQGANSVASAASSETISICSPELLLPLAALPCEVGGGASGTEGDPGDLEGSSPPPPPSPVSWPMEASPEEAAPEVGVSEEALQEAGGSSMEAPWVLEEIAFDGRRSAFVVTLVQRVAHKLCTAEAQECTRRPLRHTKVFYCLCRSRDKTATVAARYAELRQRTCLSPNEAEAAQTLSDEGETDEEGDRAALASAAGDTGPLKGGRGIERLLQEVGEGLELLQLRRQRQALQQQRLRLFDAACQGCWFAASTIVSGAPYPLSDPPWRYRLAPAPPGAQLSEGPADVAEELRTPNGHSGVPCLPSTTKAAAHKGKGGPKFGATVPCGGFSGGSFNPYMGGEEDDSNASLSGGRKGSSSSSAATAIAADGESGGSFSVLGSDLEELPFIGDPPDAKPWPRAPVSRAPYSCFSVEAPIGGGVSGVIPGHLERVPDNPTPDTESAEASWADPSCEGTAEDATLASTSAAAADSIAADAAAATGSKTGEATGIAKAGVASGGISWAVRVSQRQKGDSWQLRMAAALLTRGFEEMRESPGERDGGGSVTVDFLLLYDSQEHRDAALKTLNGLQPPTPTPFTVAVDSERRKELRQIYDLFLEPTFAVQADDKVVRIRDAVVNIFTYPQLYIMLHCLLTWDLRLLCFSNFLVWVCGYSNNIASWFAEPADSETVSYLLNLAHTFFDRLGAAAADTGARELPADDSALLQKNRLLLQLYMAQDQREASAGAGGQPGSPQDGGLGAAGATAAANSPAGSAATATPRLPGASVGGGGSLVASPMGASPPGASSAAAGGYKEEVLQVAGVGPVDFTLPDGVKFDKSKLAFRCLWREGSAPIRLQQQQQQLQQQGMASPKTPAASGPPRWPGAPTPLGVSLLKSQSSQQQNRSRTFSCRKYGLYQSKLLAMQARLASELLVPQPPATTRNRIAALPAIVFGLLPLPEPVESAHQAVEGIPVGERDRQTRRVNWQQLLQQGGWKGGCTDAAFAEAAADAVEALVGDNTGHTRPSSKRKRHTGAPQRASTALQQQMQQQHDAAQAAASLRSSRPSEEPTLLSPADASAAWSLTPGSRPGAGGPQGSPQGPLDSPAAWVVQAGDGTDGRVLQQQALSSRVLLACVWEHAACRWRVTLAAGPDDASGGASGGGVSLGRSCFFFSPAEPGKKKAALLLARRWAASQLLRGERLCVLARPVIGTETALDFLQSCPGLWTAEDEADVNTLPLLSPQQLRSVTVSCESAGAAGFAAAVPETGLNTCPTTPSSTFDCSSGFGGGAPLSRLTAADGGPPLQLSADAVAAGGGWCDWQSPQNALGAPFTPVGGGRPPWGPPGGEGSTAEGGPPAKKAKSRSRPTKQSVPMDEAAAERLRSQKAAAARVRWMRYRMQQEAEAQQLTAALAATLTDRPHMQDNNLNPLTAIFPM